MSIDLGVMSVKIGLEGSEFDRGMQKAGATIEAVGKKMEKIGRSLTAKVTAPILAMSAASVKAFADFDDAMTKSTSIMTDVTPQLRKEMESTARVMSTEAVTSATDLAESYFFLASAGLDAEKSMKSLSTVNNFAIAGTFDMALATDLLTDAQSALGLSAKDATTHMKNMNRVSDVLVKANTLANASVLQFSKSLTTKSGAALRDLGKDVEEGVAVLAAFADQGKKGEAAGEALTMVLRDLQRASIANKEIWDQMGVSVFDANEKMLPLADIIGQLETHFGGMTDEGKKTAAMMMGFQDRSFSALQALMGTSDAIRNYEAQLRQAGGTTDMVAKKNMTSFTAQMKILKNQLTDVAIDIGEKIAPMIAQLSEYIKKGMKWWKALTDEQQDMIIKFSLIAAAAGPVVLILGKMITFGGALIQAFTTLKTAGMAVFTALKAGGIAALLPFIKFIAIAAAVVLAIKVATDAIYGPGSFAQAWENVWASVKTFGKNVIGFFSNFRENMTSLWKWFKDNWSAILVRLPAFVANAVTDMINNFYVMNETTIRIVMALVGYLGKMFKKLFSVDFVNYVWDGLKAAADAILDWGKKAADVIASVWSGPEAFARAKAAFTNMGKMLSGDMLNGFEQDLAPTLKKIIDEQKAKFQFTSTDAFKDLKGPDLNLKPFYEGAAEGAKQLEKMSGSIKEIKKVTADMDIATPVIKATKAQKDLNEQTAQTLKKMEEWNEVWDSIGETVGSAFEQAIFEAKNAKEVLKGLVEDISRIIFRQMVTQQIAKAVSGALGSAFGGGAATGAGATAGATVASANGNVFNRPVSFPLGGGRTGTMAERGPEAIVPLERDETGKLGMRGGDRVVVNQYIETPDPGAFKRSEKQTARRIQSALR